MDSKILQINNIIKKKKISKKKKSSWRKFSQKTEVENYFEEKRFNERIGGAISEKTDDQIFFVEKRINSPMIQKSIKRENLRSSNLKLKCHSALLPDLNAPDLHNESTKRGIKAKKSNQGLKLMKKPKLTKLPVKATLKSDDNFYDLWAKNEINESDNVIADYNKHWNTVCKKISVKQPANYRKKPNELGAVPLPLPGMSYNPSFKDHQELLAKAVEVELKKEKEEKRILRATDEKYPTEAPSQESWLQEMSAGLFELNSAKISSSNVDLFNQKTNNNASKDKKRRHLTNKLNNTINNENQHSIGNEAENIIGVIKNNTDADSSKKKFNKQKLHRENKGKLNSDKILEFISINPADEERMKFDTKYQNDDFNKNTSVEDMELNQGNRSESEDDINENISNNPPVRREDKITERERRKIKEREKIEVQRKRQKMEEIRMKKDALRIKSHKKELIKREMKIAAKIVHRQLEKEKCKNDPKKLGKVRFVEPPLALKLTDELPGSLRKLKPEGHIIQDIVKSLQRRNMTLASIKPKKSKRYSRKVFEKNSHKSIVL